MSEINVEGILERLEPYGDDCPFCHRDPYHYVDIGVGMERAAVNCCDLGNSLIQYQDEQLAAIVQLHRDAAEIIRDLAASLNRASDACASVQRERDAWKGALIDELIVDHIYTNWHEDDPKKALADAIAWNVSVALDPAVSSDAAALVERGRQDVLRDAVELARFAWDHYPNPDINHVDYRVEVARKAEAFLSRYEGGVK